MYTTKFKLPTIAADFKIVENNLSKPIGARAKLVVGADIINTPAG